jgi:hypothetical protein
MYRAFATIFTFNSYLNKYAFSIQKSINRYNIPDQLVFDRNT